MILILLFLLTAAAFGMIGTRVMGGNKLGFTDLMTLAQGAGFSLTEAPVAAAIALAESSGNPQAYNPEKQAGTPEGKGSYGLWQIYLRAHPEFEGQDLYDPQTNARAAFSVYANAGGFKPWSTYNNLAYQAHIPEDYLNV
jgi:Lysozyme like domain